MARTNRNWKQRDVGKRLGEIQGLSTPVDHKTVWKWEAGKSFPDGPNRLALAKLFAEDATLVRLLSLEPSAGQRVAEPPSVPNGSPDALAGELTAIAEALLGVVRRMRGGAPGLLGLRDAAGEMLSSLPPGSLIPNDLPPEPPDENQNPGEEA